MNKAHPQGADKRPCVLFFGEAVTLAHVARPRVLAGALSSERYDVHFACDPRYEAAARPMDFPFHPIHSLSSAEFLHRLATGQRLYDIALLRAYVEQDIALIEALKPDLIVGDFRLSLAVSAPRCGVSYMTITNAYWSPYARAPLPLPELGMNRLLGLSLARSIFRMVRPLAFAYHAAPLNRLRSEAGLPPLGSDLRRVYTHADHTLYADVPELIPTYDAPSCHHYLGPILWSATSTRPLWWDEVPADKPLIYISMGSSGRSDLLPTLAQASLETKGVGMIATAGRTELASVPGKIYVADYLPGDEAVARADMVICNGGSPTAYQALAAGKPVLGVPSNLDQHLNMHYLDEAGLGLTVRSEQADVTRLRRAIETLLFDENYRRRTSQFAQTMARHDAQRSFAALVDALGH